MSNIQDREPSTGTIWVDPNNKIEYAQAVDAFEGVSASAGGGRREFRSHESNISVRNTFRREDYEYFRTEESTPKNQATSIAMAMSAYRKVGIVRNIIDLMGDFGSQGVRISHPSPQWQKFLRGWFAKVNGVERSERFLNHLYRMGNVVARRHMMRLRDKDVKKMRAHGERAKVLKPDAKMPPTVRPSSRTVPIKYTFLNPLTMRAAGGALGQFTGEQIYALKLSWKLKQAITHPTDDLQRQLASKLPADIIAAAKSGKEYIALDQNKISVHHYKKDDWQAWAYPMTEAVMDDLMMLEKMKLADVAALDGAISQVRIWKLGSLEHELFPSSTAISKLVEILLSNPGGGAFDLVWGPDLTLEETSTEIHKFLGSAKYEPVLNSIYAGLGVPPTLTGAATASGFTNNFISIQTLIKRLQYGRDRLTDFWNYELSLVQEAMGFRDKAIVEFDHISLSDENSENALLIQLADRGIINSDAILERMGQNPDLVRIRNNAEEKQREEGTRVTKAGPWHAPEKEFDLIKLALQRGLITPGEAGLSDHLGERREGEKTDGERMDELKKAQIQQSKQSGQPQKGRPKNSSDTSKRKQKTVKPRTSAAEEVDRLANLAAMGRWATWAQAKIHETVHSSVLEFYGKTDTRQLTASQVEESEEAKFKVLLSYQPFSEVAGVSISEALKNKANHTRALRIYESLTKAAEEKVSRKLTLEDKRALQVLTYSIVNGE